MCAFLNLIGRKWSCESPPTANCLWTLGQLTWKGVENVTFYANFTESADLLDIFSVTSVYHGAVD